ncbi:hypothetical protein M1271_02190 [Patescibacteria group bacterium]|nr:hypothetical protein [Patescibacteria group bacterium]MCL5798342.1 hypothetical protein [Patescibacteria group bacterium]
MKRPKFLTIWLILLLIFSVAITIDSLTYLSFILLTKNYISLVGIIAGFVQIWAVVQLLRWKKIGVTLFISSAIAVFMITAINEFNIVSKVNQIIVSLLAVLVVNIVILGILYLAIRPVWKNFK